MNSVLRHVLAASLLVLSVAAPADAQRINRFAGAESHVAVPELDGSGWDERPGWALPLAGAVIGGTVAYLVNPDCSPQNEYVCPIEVGGRVLLWAAVGGVVGFLVDRIL